MKKLFAILLLGIFLLTTVGCATNRTMTGAGVGAGAGGLASIIAGKSGSTAGLLIMGGALLGGLIGNAMDQEAQKLSAQPQNQNKIIIAEEHHPNTGSTNCHKVTKRHWKNGTMTHETTEEVCTGNKKSNTY